jgi:uroporphyrinogen III methyltransferase/synthase
VTPARRVFRVGTRASRLARLQTAGALDRFRTLFPGCAFEEVVCSSPGDRDHGTDLKVSPPDFFTKDMDEAVLGGRLDFAVHSAKDLPDPMPRGLDWFWLPWREDPRDVIVLPRGETLAALPAAPRVGISSARREAWCRARFPRAELRAIRGAIEERLAQLDAGNYDLLIIAAAALNRLNLQDRISEWIPLDALAPPDGQGALAVTFRAGDTRLERIRGLFVKSVSFVGAGTGSAGFLTLAGARALRRAEVCLYDSLMDAAVLGQLPPSAARLDVGKRCGAHAVPQPEITRLIADYARRGLRVVRLKGGDPGIFGRLAEEVEALESLALPYVVIPGVSALSVATTGTGLLLTRRGVSRGFCVMTPREAGGGVGSVAAADRARLPAVFFMATTVAPEVARQLQADGWAATTPTALVFDAGGDEERIVRATLAELAVPAADARDERAGLLIVGEVARYGYRRDAGALAGARVLVTCSEDLVEKTAGYVRDWGGVPVARPLIRLTPDWQALAGVGPLAAYDGLVLTSPTAVRCLGEWIEREGLDIRAVPPVMVCGPGTADALRALRLRPALAPTDDFGAAGLIAALRAHVTPGQRLLRLRSGKAGGTLAVALAELGAEVRDCVLYRHEPVAQGRCPAFDAVCFASGSAVEAFVKAWDVAPLAGKVTVAIGGPTARAMAAAGIRVDGVAAEATMEGSIRALATAWVNKELQ